MYSAIVIGATGMVGRALLQQLQADERFSHVQVFGRRTAGTNHPKITEHLVDFDAPESWQHLVKGDVLFSTLGTTLKQAGSKAAQYKVDYGYQYSFASAAAANGVEKYVLVSAAGAGENSMIFYSRMKGELERDVKKLPFGTIHLLRPGLLFGNREHERPAELWGFRILRMLNRAGLLRKQRPIHANQVAKAMINAAVQSSKGIHSWTLTEVFELAGG